MLTIFAVIFILGTAGFAGYTGARDGAYNSAFAACRSLLAFLVAMTFCESLAALLAWLLGGAYPLYDYLLPACFVMLIMLVFFISRRLRYKFTPATVPLPSWLDMTTGPIFGVLGAVVLTGIVLILYSLLPFTKFIGNDSGHFSLGDKQYDTGARMLEFYDYVEDRFGGNDHFLNYGAEKMVAGKDANLNGMPDDEKDEWYDQNHNGVWDRGWMTRYQTPAFLTRYDYYRIRGNRSESEPTPEE